MREEMQQHIEMQAAEFEAEGMSPAEALRKARKAFGNKLNCRKNAAPVGGFA